MYKPELRYEQLRDSHRTTCAAWYWGELLPKHGFWNRHTLSTDLWCLLRIFCKGIRDRVLEIFHHRIQSLWQRKNSTYLYSRWGSKQQFSRASKDLISRRFIWWPEMSLGKGHRENEVKSLNCPKYLLYDILLSIFYWKCIYFKKHKHNNQYYWRFIYIYFVDRETESEFIQ